MDDVVGGSATSDDAIGLFAASLAHDPDGIDLPYLVLDHIATSHRLQEALLVLRPGGIGPQIFVRGRQPISSDLVPDLLDRQTGLYTEPDHVAPTARAALAGICNAALAGQVLRRSCAVDEASGLASRPTIDSALVRATAAGARYGWTFTAVLLTTAGDGAADWRWRALCEALRAAVRVGDEVGVAGEGRALAILGNAGPDVVRPFVARVRAALSNTGAEGVDLHAATVTSPAETVDPEALWSLAHERLDELVGQPAREPERPADFGGGPGRPQLLPGPLELALRCLPGVVSVGPAPHPSGVGYQLAVVAVDPPFDLAAQAGRCAREHRIDAPVVVHAVVREEHRQTVPSPGTPRPAGEGPNPDAGRGSNRALDPDVGQEPGQDAGWQSANGAAKTAVMTLPLPSGAVRPLPPGAVRPLPSGAVRPLPPEGFTAVTGTAAVPVPVAPPAAATDAPAPQHPEGRSTGRPDAAGVAGAGPLAPASPQQVSAPGHLGARAGSSDAAGGPAVTMERVTLIGATFDPDTGTSEVRLSRGGALGVGRATVGPMAGGAQATLAALDDLGGTVPYYLVSAERAHTVPGEPVVVVLAPRRPAGGSPGATPAMAERIGVATGDDVVGAASRATLNALNRYLSGAVEAGR